jgi:hypothetical protein
VLRSSERASWLTCIRARIWAGECESIGSTVNFCSDNTGRWEGEMPDFRWLFGKSQAEKVGMLSTEESNAVGKGY